VSESPGRAAGTRGKPVILTLAPRLSKIAERVARATLENAAASGSAVPTGRARLAPASAAAYDLYFDRDKCRATKTGFADNSCNACPIGGRGRCGYVLHAVRPLRQRRVSQYGLADRFERTRCSGKGRDSSARRILDGDGVGPLLARYVCIRGGGFQDAFDRRCCRRISCREPTHRPGQLENATRHNGRARLDDLRSARTRQSQVASVKCKWIPAFAGMTDLRIWASRAFVTLKLLMTTEISDSSSRLVSSPR
jgi:hypothetical protein